jgi:hypothetical protein
MIRHRSINTRSKRSWWLDARNRWSRASSAAPLKTAKATGRVVGSNPAKGFERKARHTCQCRRSVNWQAGHMPSV